MRSSRDPGPRGTRGIATVVVAAALCCGAAALLVSAGVLAAGAGLFGSPELTVLAIVAAASGMWRLVAGLHRRGGGGT